MADVVIRPLVAGEENLFDSMPDPLPQLRKVGYADGIAGGGYRPETTWVALRDGRVVGRAAWLLPPGAVGAPWLERFDLDAEPEVGAELLRAAHDALGGPARYYAALPAHWRRRPEVRAVVEAPMAAARLAGLVERGERLRCSWTGTPLPATSGRYAFRPAADAAEINALVARIAEPDVLTGAEIARAVSGVDLATDPLAWLPDSVGDWRVALDAGEPVGLVGPAGDACYPLIAYLGLLDEAARPELLAEAVRVLAAGGAREVIADVDAHRVAVLAELERTGFRQLRARVLFAPAADQH
ncbi:acetyltransferase [Micromonospora sp. STR1_7]|uniref:Acetyltransferase n=1 Tax=Micromonospora parastrephiae TaxID=2806101 RepID=A0ABS1XYQ3_9ACTN|nr:acetyltransferase [Micromonospora parastrephiae]MBM0234279.1 acetyltransferase [Micromonospora parastrephiae]